MRNKKPPFEITNAMIHDVAEIAELVGQALNGSNEFKKAVIRMICSRTDSELKVLEDALRIVYESIKEE